MPNNDWRILCCINPDLHAYIRLTLSHEPRNHIELGQVTEKDVDEALERLAKAMEVVTRSQDSSANEHVSVVLKILQLWRDNVENCLQECYYCTTPSTIGISGLRSRSSVNGT